MSDYHMLSDDNDTANEYSELEDPDRDEKKNIAKSRRHKLLSHQPIIDSPNRNLNTSLSQLSQGGYGSDPELFAPASPTVDQFKRIRRTLHLKKIDRTRFREEGEKRRKAKKYDEEKQYRVAAHCVCESFELTEILSTLIGNKAEVGRPVLYSDVICFKEYKGKGDVFVFSYGVVVFWGFRPDDEASFLAEIKQSQTDPLPDPEYDDFLFSYGEKSDILSDTITLASHDSLEKLSASFAIAQSVKLSVFEERIENQIESNKHLPERLAKHGKISLDRLDISRKIGQLFIERNSVNLHSDILDTPEFFWEQDTYQSFYHRIYNYLEIGKRVGVLNRRLDIMKELFEMLGAELQDRHSSNLEYIIIWLIVIEVAIEVIWQILLKDVFKIV